MRIKEAQRLRQLPPYLFVEIDKAKRAAQKEGRDIIDLGIGDPDQPTPSFIIEKMYEAAKDNSNHRYALDSGMPILKEAIRSWYKRRFNVELNVDSQILPLIGSKEGIAHFPLAVLNRGDYALVPDPCYPPYKGGTLFALGKIYIMPLLEKNKFLPDLKKIPKTVLKNAKVIFINYPNNPTGAVATDEFYKDLIQFALKNNLIIACDMAYSEMTYDGYKAKSLLEFEGAGECTVEFHSLSKTYNMTGWRIGWACGNAQAISLLGKVKSNIDSGIFKAIQVAGACALDKGDTHISGMQALYQGRRDVLVSGLREAGFKVENPKATFYVWANIPGSIKSSIDFAKMLLEKSNIVATPGIGFGKNGEGYIRFALTVGQERLKEAVQRLKKILI